jgi:hypothetical protein
VRVSYEHLSWQTNPSPKTRTAQTCGTLVAIFTDQFTTTISNATMLSFFKGLFTTKTDKASFPKISLGFRGEDLEYVTENDSLDISSTWISGRRIYMDNLQNWKSNKIISSSDKEVIFKNIVEFLNNKTKEKPIVVINVDHDKELWENLCEQYKEQISSIEYQSDKEKDQFMHDTMLDNIRRGGSLIDGNQTITTEEQFLEYWKNRVKK